MSEVMSDLPSSHEAIDFLKVPFLSTSQQVLFQLVEFSPRWEFLLLHAIFSGRSYCLLGNSGNNVKLCFLLNEILIIQEMIDEPTLCLASVGPALRSILGKPHLPHPWLLLVN